MKEKFCLKEVKNIGRRLGFTTILWFIGCLCLISNGFAQTQADNKKPDFIERFDQDNDNKVSSDEFNGPDIRFDRLDQNDDGFIDESEKPKGPPPGDKNKGKKNHFERIDKNDDKKISKDEFPGPDKRFTKLDKNGDGFLDESELPSKPPPKKRDKNGQSDRAKEEL
ncbi:MAG: hypothetical protein GY710_14275 [Desulfobacteraceae bacterium]|nr:hypothetical protein [Desulfobacteraceae bacterium]